MKSVHLEPKVLIARFYPKGKSYENRDEFNGVATVQLENNVAYISGALGCVPQYSKALFGELKKIGVKEVYWVRSNGKVVKKSLKDSTNDTEWIRT